MALALGANSGFVTAAPTADPAGTGTTIDGNAVVTKHTSPAGATKIISIGWYRASGTNSANWEIALYSDLAGVPVTRLFVDATNSTTSAGWVVTTVDWAITENTAYWLALQMDAYSGSSQVDASASGGTGSDLFAATTLATPYAGGAVADADGMYAIYALLEPPPATGSGFMNSQAADITGSGTSGSVGSGALAATVASLSGFGSVSDPASTVEGSGVLVAAAAALAGFGASGSDGSGVLIVGMASLSGFGAVSFPVVTGGGVLLSDDAQIDGNDAPHGGASAGHWVNSRRARHPGRAQTYH